MFVAIHKEEDNPNSMWFMQRWKLIVFLCFLKLSVVLDKGLLSMIL